MNSRLDEMKRRFAEKEQAMNKHGMVSPTEEDNARRQYYEDIHKELDRLNRTNRQDHVQQDLTELFKEVVRDARKDTRKRLPESIFVNHFLDYFRDVVRNKEDLADGRLQERMQKLEEWYAVSNGPYYEVEVFDDRTGQGLFVVPAMLDTGIMNPVRKREEVGFDTIVATSNLLSMQTSAQRQNYENERFNTKIKKLMTKLDHFKENEKVWEDIFERYESQPVGGEVAGVGKEETITKSKDTLGSMDVDDLVYD